MIARRDWIVALLLVMLAFALYWQGVTAIPRSDQLAFMLGRVDASSDWDFFVRALSFNRTRKLLPGDYWMFRPGMFATLALLDIFCGRAFGAIGAVSILWHAVLCCLLYLFARCFTGRTAAFIIASLFAVQFAGMEMVLFRHISPYILGLSCFTAALFFLARGPIPRSVLAQGGISSLFLLSCLFHEAAAIALPLAWLIHWGLARFSRDRAAPLSLRQSLVLFLLPAFLYWALSAADFLYFHPPGFLDLRENPMFDPLATLDVVVTVMGISGISLFAPFFVKFGILKERQFWDMAKFPHVLLLLCGTALTGLAVHIVRKAVLGRQSHPRVICVTLVGTYLTVALVGVAAGRVQLRSLTYLAVSTYYLYTFHFLLLLLGLLSFSSDSFRSKKKWLPVGAVFAGILILHNALAIQASLVPHRSWDGLSARLVADMAGKLKGLKGYCYESALSDSLENLVPSAVFVRESCAVKSGTSLYLVNIDDGRLLLASPFDQRTMTPVVALDARIRGPIPPSPWRDRGG